MPILKPMKSATRSFAAPRVGASTNFILTAAMFLTCWMNARAVTFIPGNWAAGYGSTNNFARWEQATITYSFDISFVTIYGIGAEAAVNAAFSTWNGAVGITSNPGTDISSPMLLGDFEIIGPSQAYDLESVALHEIGHALGLEHPNLANGITSTNYNVNGGGAFVAGALPGGSHPVMWSTIAPNLRRRVLTDDDLYGAQYMYDPTDLAGPGMGGIGGPTFDDGSISFTFSQVPSGGDIIIKAGGLPPGTLASTIGTAAYKPASTYGVTTAAQIIFLPEPSTDLLLMAGVVAFLLTTRRFK